MRHSFGERTPDNPLGICPLCPGDHGKPARCDHGHYSRKLLRFVQAHWEAYETAYLNPDPRAASNELERLANEYHTLPPRHDCSCYGHHCRECQLVSNRRWREWQQLGERAAVTVSIGRTQPVNAPMPSVLMLDLGGGYAA